MPKRFDPPGSTDSNRTLSLHGAGTYPPIEGPPGVTRLRIYEINTRASCRQFSRLGDPELERLSKLGFDAIWLMGVWRISEGAARISRIISPDFQGSPYAIESYELNPSLGDLNSYQALVARAHSAGLKVLLDFVPNHVALDSPWIDEDPELFIRSNPAVRKQEASAFYLHPSGEVIAHGRDPYFPPWYDTAQLDYTSPRLRARMIQVLRWISRFADGARCDMAMLVLRDQIRRLWYPEAPDEWFLSRMPGEFWDEAVREVRKERPDFIFIAEAYWDREQALIDLGFDLAYEKKLYDAMVGRNPGWILERLSRGTPALSHSLFFIENHDEPRAASLFDFDHNVSAMAMLLSLPGSVLIHDGQMEGLREKLPIENPGPPEDESPDLILRTEYELLLRVTSDPVFSTGSFEIFNPGVQGVVSFIRKDSERVVAYIGQWQEGTRPLESSRLDITAIARACGAQSKVRLLNLANSHSEEVSENLGEYWVHGSQLGAYGESPYCLVEALAVP